MEQASGKSQRITEVLQEYWQQKQCAGEIPADGDIDPIDLGELWDHCFLVQKIAANRFQYLHMGAAIVQAYGDDITGHEVCEKLVGELDEPLVVDFSKAITQKAPLLKESSFINCKQMEIRYRTCLLPLRRENGTEAEYILGGMKWKAY